MLKTRVLTALVLLIVFGPIFFWLSAFDLYLSFVGILTLAAWEWGRFLWPKNKSYPVTYAGLIFLCLTIVLLDHEKLLGNFDSIWETPFLESFIFIAVMIWLFIVPILLRKSIHLPLFRYIPYFAILGFFIFISTFLAAMLLRDQSRWLFLGVIALVWCADIGAYFVGKLFGKHKLAVNISPGKSWEGALGGVCLVCFFTLVLFQFVDTPPVSIFVLMLIGIGLAIMSVVGDLFESLIKRIVKVKDSSTLLPGHGGVLDRIDAILPVLPIAAFLLKVLL